MFFDLVVRLSERAEHLAPALRVRIERVQSRFLPAAGGAVASSVQQLLALSANEVLPCVSEDDVVEPDGVTRTRVPQSLDRFVHTFVEAIVWPVVVGLRPHRGVGRQEERINSVRHEVPEGRETPPRRMAVEEQNFRKWVSESFVVSALVVHEMSTVVEKRILCHAAILGCADTKATRVLLLKEVSWACVGVGKACAEAWVDEDRVVFGVRALAVFLVVGSRTLALLSLMAVNNHWGAGAVDIVAPRTIDSWCLNKLVVS